MSALDIDIAGAAERYDLAYAPPPAWRIDFRRGVAMPVPPTAEQRAAQARAVAKEQVARWAIEDVPVTTIVKAFTGKRPRRRPTRRALIEMVAKAWLEVQP